MAGRDQREQLALPLARSWHEAAHASRDDEGGAGLGVDAREGRHVLRHPGGFKGRREGEVRGGKGEARWSFSCHSPDVVEHEKDRLPLGGGDDSFESKRLLGGRIWQRLPAQLPVQNALQLEHVWLLADAHLGGGNGRREVGKMGEGRAAALAFGRRSPSKSSQTQRRPPRRGTAQQPRESCLGGVKERREAGKLAGGGGGRSRERGLPTPPLPPPAVAGAPLERGAVTAVVAAPVSRG